MDNYKQRIVLLSQTVGLERIKLDEPLKFHTHQEVGGPAEIFYIATSQKELISILNSAFELKIPFFVFGSGTKILISDKGIKGLVIKNRADSIRIGGIKGKVGKFGLGIEEAKVEVDSGVSIGSLNEYLAKQNLAQFQGVSSLRATIGGAMFLDPELQTMATGIKVWENGEVFEEAIKDYVRSTQIIISAILKVKAKF